jgi:hypothetical protein
MSKTTAAAAPQMAETECQATDQSALASSEQANPTHQQATPMPIKMNPAVRMCMAGSSSITIQVDPFRKWPIEPMPHRR